MANEVLPEHVRDVRDKTSAPLLVKISRFVRYQIGETSGNE